MYIEAQRYYIWSRLEFS